ncbi:MAG: TlpA family protein disulfide reductase [Acidobacteria bacterium]|nr:TlpA family protein disulfide reductase [Acidobacteriota bacterium]
MRLFSYQDALNCSYRPRHRRCRQGAAQAVEAHFSDGRKPPDRIHLAWCITLIIGASPLLPLQVAPGNQEIRAFEAVDLRGCEWDYSRLQGKVVLISFWATWCSHCLAEMPHLQDAYANYHDRGFEIIGVSVDSGTRRDFERFLRLHGITWPQVFDGLGYGGRLARQFKIRTVPESILINRQGETIARNPRGGQLIRLLERQLGAGRR